MQSSKAAGKRRIEDDDDVGETDDGTGHMCRDEDDDEGSVVDDEEYVIGDQDDDDEDEVNDEASFATDKPSPFTKMGPCVRHISEREWVEQGAAAADLSEEFDYAQKMVSEANGPEPSQLLQSALEKVEADPLLASWRAELGLDASSRPTCSTDCRDMRQ